MTIDVARDSVGLRKAIGELLERSFAESRSLRSLEFADEECGDRMFGSLPQLTLSPGYYKQAEFLLWLEQHKEVGVIGGGYTLSEADGLAAVAQARNEFNRNHPPCGMCGALQDSPFSTSCAKCGTEFLRRSA